MSEAPSSTERIVRFGVFELDLRTGELRKAGVKLGLQDQPLHVLTMLLERPGELVTREELKERLWPAQTFVDFEQGLNAAVKRLRAVLGDSADTPRYIETLPRRGYRFIGAMDRPPLAQPLPQPAPPSRRLALLSGIAAIALAVSALQFWRITRAPSPLPSSGSPPKPRVLTRLTFDPGLQMQPTWSPDGRFIAYASDKSGNFDIWVQPVAGGDAVQVTKDPAHDWEPDWSPDGSQVAFRSERQGGGIFLASALGGNERRIAAFGYKPRWSPDGTRILLAGTNFAGGHTERPAMYITRLDGSGPQQILREFLSQFWSRPSAAWHPDGQRVSFSGNHRQHGLTFWTAPVSGDGAIRSERTPEVAQAVAASVRIYSASTFAWAPSGDELFFVGVAKQVHNIWKVGVDPKSLRWTTGPERLTTGPGADTDVALSSDGRKLAFLTSTTPNARICLFPLNPVTGRVTGDGQPITPQELHSFGPDITPDGRKVLFTTEQPGRRQHQQLIEKDIASGRERRLAEDDREGGVSRFSARWSPDGARVVYRFDTPGPGPPGPRFLYSIRTMDVATGQDQEITAPYEQPDNPRGWSSDGRSIVASGPRYVPGQHAVVLLPLSAAPHSETKARIVASDIGQTLWQAVISPNDQWIAIQAAPLADTRVSTIYVVPRSGGTWMQITEGTYWDDKPRWSPDGSILYFVSSRGGVFNVWGIRFDRAHGKPVGEPFRVTSFEGPRLMILPNTGSMELGIARDRLVLPMVAGSGGIWMLDGVDR
jgi:Tol biopolymer transport system component/DNA-binding winged helix-turn-helix (wHTH) protein